MSTSASFKADTLSLRVKVFNHTSETLYCTGHKANHKIEDGEVAQVLMPGDEGNYRITSDNTDIHDHVTYALDTSSSPTAWITLTSKIPFASFDNVYETSCHPERPNNLLAASQAGDQQDDHHPVVEWYITTTGPLGG